MKIAEANVFLVKPGIQYASVIVKRNNMRDFLISRKSIINIGESKKKRELKMDAMVFI